MGKTYRGSSKEEKKDKYRQVRDERQNKRHLNEENRRQTDDRRSNDERSSQD